MIRHICMFKLKEENKKENLREALVRVEKLRGIEQIQRFEVVVNDNEAPDSNYEMSLIFDFNNMEELETYQKDQRHIEFGNFIKQVRESRACIDYRF